MNSPKPVVVLSGFLGSGKTTLLNRLLKETHGLHLAVIINELGEIGLDEGLVSGSGDFVQMTNGCLCCVLNEDLSKLLHQLKDRNDYDAVVIETTGVANPLPVAWTFLREPLDSYFRLAGLVTVVDPLQWGELLKSPTPTEALEQVLNADILYFSNTDRITSSEKSAALANLRSMKPQARFVEDGSIDFLSVLLLSDEIHAPLASPGHTHVLSYQTVSIDLAERTLKLEKVEDFFSELPLGILRAKAIFNDPTTEKTYVAHSVCGRFDFSELTTPTQIRAAVFIGKDFDKADLIKQFLENCSSH